MRLISLIAVLVAALLSGGCATFAATSGNVSIKDGNSSFAVSISSRDRSVIENYYVKSVKAKKKGLPPGLAKRGGKLPPGLAKRDKLPPGLSSEPLPVELERQLTPLPSGYVRVRVGQDIVLMDGRTRVVFDLAYGIAL
jgi:hypothetical protein